jgi:SHS2 domain-containing protein
VGYELRSHTADIAVEATGESLDAVVTALADGLAAAMCDQWPETGDRFAVTVTAESRDAVVFEYLDQLLYERDVRSVLPVDNEVQVNEGTDEWQIDATARGVALSELEAREIKAVTYSEFELVQTAGGWRGYVVFDV